MIDVRWQTLPAVCYRLTAYRWPTDPSRLPLVILSEAKDLGKSSK
jgi:hypothetical protein